jgi:urease beta subunit
MTDIDIEDAVAIEKRGRLHAPRWDLADGAGVRFRQSHVQEVAIVDLSRETAGARKQREQVCLE